MRWPNVSVVVLVVAPISGQRAWQIAGTGAGSGQTGKKDTTIAVMYLLWSDSTITVRIADGVRSAPSGVFVGRQWHWPRKSTAPVVLMPDLSQRGYQI